MSFADVAPDETTLESGGAAKGVAVAVVRENKDDSGLGRVKVSYPWHSRPSESYWARIAVPMAGSKRGMWFLPENGDEVLVAFERGDLRFPYVVGSLWNGVDKSPITNKDGKNDIRLIHTRKGHKLTFDDGAKGKVQLELNDGKRVTIDDDGVQVNDGKGNSLVIQSSSGAITIEAKSNLTLKAPQIAIQATGKLDVTASGNLTLSGALVRIN
jgi:uncharacterized protein involved in type VI secretion and phage assembly